MLKRISPPSPAREKEESGIAAFAGMMNEVKVKLDFSPGGRGARLSWGQAAGLRAAISCARACGHGGWLRPSHEPCARKVFRSGREASFPGKYPHAASSS